MSLREITIVPVVLARSVYGYDLKEDKNKKDHTYWYWKLTRRSKCTCTKERIMEGRKPCSDPLFTPLTGFQYGVLASFLVFCFPGLAGFSMGCLHRPCKNQVNKGSYQI